MSSDDYNAYIHSTGWAQRRDAALERAGHRCQVCNEAGRLEVHHRTYARFSHEVPEDLTVLCADCHHLFHSHQRRQRHRRRRERVIGPRREHLWLGCQEALAGLADALTAMNREHAFSGRLGLAIRTGRAVYERAERIVWGRREALKNRPSWPPLLPEQPSSPHTPDYLGIARGLVPPRHEEH